MALLYRSIAAIALLVVAVAGQRISTIQLDGTQYFISNQNPYAPRLNFFLAYQYCRSLGLQLASFETREKADAITMYLKNAKYNNNDFWTSGNKLGTNMLLWMSTGLPFNATFDYMVPPQGQQLHHGQAPTSHEIHSHEDADPALNSARNLDVSNLGHSCVALTNPELEWRLHECGQIKDFICEQTRCYYYNYGSIPVSAAQGNPRPPPRTTTPFSAPLPSPTTPYPGLLENSVAPEKDVSAGDTSSAASAAVIAALLHDGSVSHDQQQEASSNAEEDDLETHERDSEDLSEHHDLEEEHEHQDDSGAVVSTEMETSEEMMHPTTSPHLSMQAHQPKRLEDLFPFERTRPIVWPRNNQPTVN